MKILLAEDSRTVIAYLEAIFRRTPDVTLLPVAHDGATVGVLERSDVVDLMMQG